VYGIRDLSRPQATVNLDWELKTLGALSSYIYDFMTSITHCCQSAYDKARLHQTQNIGPLGRYLLSYKFFLAFLKV